MVKGEDAIRKKKNKANRKKMQKDTSTVSARVASIIAAKKRRKSGKRSSCQGMCFSLPTPENPFNDKQGSLDTRKKETKNIPPRKVAPGRNHANIEPQEQKMLRDKNLGSEQTKSRTTVDNVRQKSIVKPTKAKIQLMQKSEADHAQQAQGFDNSGCPSKFLFLCLNSIQNALRHDGTLSSEEDKPLFVDTWGVEFWRYYSFGKDILETSGACSTIEQISWIASTAADTIVRKEKEGQSFTSPFLLFLVPSQEKATKVRMVCKSLKSLGIHSVSLHSGASLDHQIHGLKSCEPEFIVSTTERLLELVSLKAIDISGVSLLVVDGLGTFSKSGCLDSIKSIRQAISGNPQCVVFNDGLNYECVPLLQNLLRGSICRLSLNDSITSQSDCIIQSVHVCGSEEEKISKGIQILDQACGNQLGPQLSKVLFVVGKGSSFHKLVAAIKLKGYSVSTKSIWSKSEVQISKKRSAVLVVDAEQICTADLGEFEVVIIPDFVHSIDSYLQMLTRMARYSVNGMLHSFLTREEAQLVRPLIEILEQCRQTVPESLRNLCNDA
ncbi:uncharacterized protein LOC132271141 isoform X2 [Cornus florida]|uniref:uncharacterized protein LOC132271141 isoform X2 n=1 Tax=Cornus florida TaxID=4283 RepID=UPI00289EA0F0|nr:uncharacterized protein LOC132271141 isoform X2 [Cornus florida]